MARSGGWWASLAHLRGSAYGAAAVNFDASSIGSVPVWAVGLVLAVAAPFSVRIIRRVIDVRAVRRTERWLNANVRHSRVSKPGGDSDGGVPSRST